MSGSEHMSVHPGQLSAGVNKVAALFGDCETATTGIAEALSEMVSAAGHPGLSNALSTFTESSAKALISTGRVLTYVGANLKETASGKHSALAV